MTKKTIASLALGIALHCLMPVMNALAVDLSEGDIVVVDRFNSGLVKIDPATGAQEFILVFALDDPQFLAVDRDGTIIVTEEGLDAVSRVDPVTGEITTIASGEPTLCGAVGVVIEADGNIIVADKSSQRLIRLNPVTGEDTVLAEGGLFLDPTGLALEADGSVVIADGNAGVIRVDPVTGAQTLVTPIGPELFFPGGIAVEANGDILVSDYFDDRIIRVDPVSGVQTVVTDFVVDEPQDVAVEADGTVLVATDTAGVVRLDPVSGVRTPFSSDPSDDLIGVTTVPALGPKLSISGTCPGDVTGEVSNATPNGLIAILASTAQGSFTLPPGPCSGTEVGLAAPNLVRTLRVDASGALSVTRTLGAAACGRLVQAVDAATCGTTRVSAVP